MKKASLILSFSVFLLILSACNIPGSPDPEVDVIATQVERLLTESASQEQPVPTETMAPSPTETQAPVEETPTQTATSTETPTATPVQDDPAQQLGSAAWTQDFSGGSSPWDFDSPQATFETANGYLNMTATTNPNWHSWYVSSPKLQNAYVEATITMDNCSGVDRFGLAVRSSSDGQQFYYMAITCDGRWGFFRMAPDVTINEIRGYQTVEPLNDITSTPHRIGIWMKGSNFTFFVDGEEIGSASEGTLTDEGFTGFLIAYANTPGFTVRVDQLRYWNVP